LPLALLDTDDRASEILALDVPAANLATGTVIIRRGKSDWCGGTRVCRFSLWEMK
jgi:hypothetical protein